MIRYVKFSRSIHSFSNFYPNSSSSPSSSSSSSSSSSIIIDHHHHPSSIIHHPSSIISTPDLVRFTLKETIQDSPAPSPVRPEVWREGCDQGDSANLILVVVCWILICVLFTLFFFFCCCCCCCSYCKCTFFCHRYYPSLPEFPGAAARWVERLWKDAPRGGEGHGPRIHGTNGRFTY